MSSNADFLDRSLRAVWHPCTQMKQHERIPLVPIARGQGVWLFDFDGRRYLDGISSWWVNLFGHGNTRIADAISRQARELEHVMLAGFTHGPVVELSERLAKLAPKGLGHVFYGSDGASAVEIALKMSFHSWRNAGRAGKSRFLSLTNGYHGETLGALGVTDVALFRDAYGPLMHCQARVPSPDWRMSKEGESPMECAARAAGALENYLRNHHQTIAALIVEPLVQGAGGMAMYHPSYLSLAREICTRFDVHLIADEIMVGFGRTGSFFACEQANIMPDFLCLSKGITGGFLALSAVLTTEPVYAAFYDDDIDRAFLHSHSYTGNAIACAASLAVLDIFRDDEVLEENRRKSSVFADILAPVRAHPKVSDFRSTGMIWAFEVLSDRVDFGRWCFTQALAHEVLLRPIGNTVYFMPPYVINDQEMALLSECMLVLLDAA